MFTNTPSVQVAQDRLRKFHPPFCANPACIWHFPDKIDEAHPFQSYGAPAVLRFPYISPRFRCTKCKKTFSSSFFGLQYRDRKNDFYEAIFADFSRGLSGREIAKRLHCNEDTIRRKKKKMARQGLLLWARDLSQIRLKESVAFDGLENFAYSQYDPNNINHAIGRKSLYLYDFNLSPMNRKGRVSPRQKRRMDYLDEKHGRYDGCAIQKDAKRIFSRLLERSDGDVILHTDNHYAYRRAIGTLKQKERLVHLITPAKLHRNFQNRLFAINHSDLMTRQYLAAFKRETIAFAKNTISMAESFILFAIDKNYLQTKFSKKHIRDPLANIESPAMALKLKNRVLPFRAFFGERISVHHVSLSEDWQNYFDSWDPSSRRYIRPYCGI